ncbi:hypothetical protein SNE40_014971 [Patella caerulea]
MPKGRCGGVKSARTKRKRMMAALRKDLMNRRQLNSLNISLKHQYSASLPVLTTERLNAANLDTRRSFQKTRSSRNTSVMSTSSGTDETCLSPNDLRKMKMLQTLLKMGTDLPKKKTITKEEFAQSDEKKVLKYLANSSRRGSLTARTLVSFQRKTSFDNDSSADESSSESLLPPIPPEKKKFASKARALSWLHSKRSQDFISPEPVKVSRRRKKKQNGSKRFRRLAKFLVVFFRSWKIHATKVHQVLGYIDSLQLMSDKPPKQDLLFDITEYKGTKEASLSQEAKRILRKRSTERTPAELRYVQVALGNYKSVASYPSRMRKLIAEKGWYEEFESKRVIVREGHVPMGFYFILSGSALVSEMDEDRQMAQTILVLTRGDSFGELAIVNRSRRQATVISKEPLELLVLSNNDFIEIFMVGGMADSNEPFLRSIPCLKGWPIERLSDDGDGSKNVMFSYFKRGTVLVKDSLKSDWVFIIKSGSCDVMKKLETVDITKTVKIKENKDWKVKLKDELKSEKTTGISHEEKIRVAFDDKIIQLQQINQRIRNTLLPVIEDEQNEQISLQELTDTTPSRPVLISQGSSRHTDKSITREASGKLSNIENLLQRRPYMSSSNSSHPSTVEVRGSVFESKNGVHQDTSVCEESNPPSRELCNSCTSHSKRVETPPNVPTFVSIQNLVKGGVFGIQDLFFEDQPQFILVSRGVECIMISKKFYMQHASHAFLTKLREKVYPYPSEADLQSKLEHKYQWQQHKKEEIYEVIKCIKLKKRGPANSRYILPKIATY